VSEIQSSRKSSLIFLYGPPASGKSTLGKLLAESLALPFFDLDQRIEEKLSLTIPEIFDKAGEESFRRHEKELLQEVLNFDWGVIALGGGTLLDPENRSLVERAGPIVCLTVSAEVLLQRVHAASNDRPLLTGEGNQASSDRLVNLLAQRESHYASFTDQIDSASKSPEQIAWEIQIRLGAFHLRGMTGSNSRATSGGSESTRPRPLGYDVRVGEPVVIPPGETSKIMETVSYLWQQFLEGGLERGGTVVALGGGVVGDLAGFAAATYKRGVSWVVLPTSLLAMVDASLGGKTGADLPQGKNLVGAFHAPRLVLTDPGTLDTLPRDELRSGMAEVIKSGIIGDASLFEKCSSGWQEIESNWGEIIRRAMAVKIRIIEADPYEGGVREVLNLGHTVGHAVELVSNFELRHGEAVAIGMVAEARLAEKISIADPGLSDQIGEVCSLLGLPVKIPKELSREDIVKVMQMDKKRAAGRVRFSLPSRVGEVQTGIEVENFELLIS
jgi:3-dehydroquinate synthase